LIANYYLEIIGLIILLSILSIYLLTRNKKDIKSIRKIDLQEKLDADENILEIEIEDEFDNTSDEQNQKSQLAMFSDSFDDIENGTEEGSFGKEQFIEPEVEDTPKTTFNKIIPLREVPAHGKIVKENFKEFAGTRILVAEDNIINQKVLRALLQDTSIEVVMADDGQEALDILTQDSNFTLILMDAHMPRVDGFQATIIIRANPDYNHILVVALSGDTATDDIKKMSEAGMQEHLEKPLRMDHFYDILYAYTGKEELTTMPSKVLNIEEGIFICSGDEDFYYEILNEFVASYASSADIIQTYFNNTQFKEIDRLLLDVVGIASNIGATNLHVTALLLKNKLLNNEIMESETILKEYNNNLQLLIKEIQKLS
jgi:CheY-like chemotaxis protein